MDPIDIFIRPYTFERVRSVRQKAKDRRDFRVLTRIFVLVAAMIASGMSTLGISLFFQFFCYLPFWSTQFQWLTVAFFMCIISTILIFVSPNLQNFWRPRRSVNLQI